MQSNPTGRGGTRRKRSSLTSGGSDPTKKTKAVGGDDISAAVETHEFPVDDAFKKTGDSTVVIHHSPQPSIEILNTDCGGGRTGPLLQHQVASTAVTGGNSSMPHVSQSENKSGSSRLNYHLPLRIGSWIEDTPFMIPPEMQSWFGSSGGKPTDMFYPNIDLLCRESVATDSAKDGGVKATVLFGIW